MYSHHIAAASKRNPTAATLGSISPTKGHANKNLKSDVSNAVSLQAVGTRIALFMERKEEVLEQEIAELGKLLSGLQHKSSQTVNDSDTSSASSSWRRDDIHADVHGNFITTKLEQDEISSNFNRRINQGRQLQQDDSLEHKRNLATFRYLSALIKEDFVDRVYPHQPENIELMLHPRSDYSNDSDVHYVISYDDKKTLPKPGDTGYLKKREDLMEYAQIAVVGTSAELLANGYVDKDVVDEVVARQIIGRGYDDNSKVKRLATSKAARQVAEAQTAFGYNCKDGSVLEHALSIPSLRLRQLTDGRFMFDLLKGNEGVEIVSIIGKYITGYIQTISFDTWPKMDDYLRKIDELMAMIHSKHERGGVNPYLDSCINDDDKYVGFKACNVCPYAALMNELATKISRIIDSGIDDRRVQILELLNDTNNATDPYFGPPDKVYAEEAIDALELLAKDGTVDARTTIIGMRYSNVNAILESKDPTIKQWREENLEELKEIPGGVVKLEGNNTIEARKMKLVLFRGEYLLLVRGSSFCMFDGKQDIHDALRFCLEYVEEAVLRYCLGLLSLDGLAKVMNMMQSYAMLVVGPSGSVSNPNGSTYDPIHLVLPEGVVGAIEGQSGSMIAGAKEIEAVFDGALHYYGVVSMVEQLGVKKFNQLVKIMGSKLTVRKFDKFDKRLIFVDGDGKFFDYQYDNITVEGDVDKAFGHLCKLSDEMIACLLTNEPKGISHEELLGMVELISGFESSLYGGAAITNNRDRSRRKRTDKMIEYLIGEKRQDLVNLVSTLASDINTLIFWKWWTAILERSERDEKLWVKLQSGKSVLVLPSKDHLYTYGNKIRNLPNTDWRKKIVMASNLNWQKYDEAQIANATNRLPQIGEVNEAAAKASHAQNKEGNDYEEGEEDVYGNPFGN